MRGLQDKVGIVTGAASGLGRSIALRLAEEGVNVTVADLNGEGAEWVRAEIESKGGRAIATTTDVSDEAAVASMVEATLQAFGRVDALYNNAAALGAEVVVRDADLLELDVETWDRTMAVNLRGVMLGCRHAIPAMLAAGGGSIVNTASTGAYQGTNTRSAYGASKAGIVGFTRYVASMYGGRNIRCNAVAPGYMANPDTVGREVSDQADMARYERLLPEAATPDDVAAVAVFLASQDARAVTGQCYVVDAGRLAHKPSDSVRQALQERAAG